MELKTIDEKFYYFLGKELNEIRASRKLSLREMAKLTGLSRTLLDRYELGIARITPKNWDYICKALQVSPSLKVDITIGFTK